MATTQLMPADSPRPLAAPEHFLSRSAWRPSPPRTSLCWAWIVVLVAIVTAGCSGAASAPVTSTADLTNPFLGVEHSQWLVGPVSRLATSTEVEEYLSLRDDLAATTFIESFWARRNPFPDEPGNQLRERFEQRAVEADRRFSEAGYAGRRTARGTIFVLYGEPEKTEYQIEATPPHRTLEEWSYPADAAAGLDGAAPQRLYRFVKQGDLTVFYTLAARQSPLLR